MKIPVHCSVQTIVKIPVNQMGSEHCEDSCVSTGSEHCEGSCVPEAHVYTQGQRPFQTTEATCGSGLRGLTRKIVELDKNRLKVPRSHILRAAGC